MISPRSSVLRTRITPPGRSQRTLARPRLRSLLAQALTYPLTILQAGAGCGKTTALADLAETGQPLIWYTLREEDSDPQLFLLYLLSAVQQALPELPGLPLPFLEAAGANWDAAHDRLPAGAVLDQALNALNDYQAGPLLLVFDDLHAVAEAPEIAHLLDRLVGLAPTHLHVIASTRQPLSLPNLARWKVQGRVLQLDQSALAFTPEEITLLYTQHYAYELTPEEALALYAVTEGWAIAVQLVWQSLRSPGSGAPAGGRSLDFALARPAATLEGLFDLLAQEVFGSQPLDVQEFMLISATLREMTPQACDALRGSRDSSALLSYLRRQELFVVDSSQPSDSQPRLRYHNIFHEFLQQQADPQARRLWHRRAGGYYLGEASSPPAAGEQPDYDAAIYHLLQGEDLPGAAKVLETYGPLLLSAGRLDSLAAYLDSLTPGILHQHPNLLCLLGDLARLRSRFQEALGWYEQAEAIARQFAQVDVILRALRGQARLYLDTVNPSRAEEILQQTLRLSDGIEDREAQARLYELLAENRLNAGRVDEAEKLRLQAEALRIEGPSNAQLELRVLLRTGRLDEARRQLEARAEAERSQPVLTPRAHRETLLLLSLVYSFQGLGQQALQAAQEGTRRGAILHSPFITAVGHIRQGHTLMLLPDGKPPSAGRYAESRGEFEKAVAISHELAVPRLLVETYWGLCRNHGYQGDLPQAISYAQKAVDIAAQAGDEWVASLARLAMGASLVLGEVAAPGFYAAAAEDWLNQAARGFLECSDPFGQAAARLWLCLVWQRRPELDAGQRRSLMESALPRALAACRQNGYDFLLTRPSLLGPPDERLFVPLLVAARQNGWEANYAARLLGELGLEQVVHHPGFTLRVQTLGSFAVWRGAQPLPPNAWRREKSRQLFQLLVTHRNSLLDREQIIEHLWPGVEPAAAQRNFKVALNTLFQVLEPDRDPGRDSAFIYREGSLYGLRPGADVWIDAAAFLDLARQADVSAGGLAASTITQLQQALALYQGDFLPEARYETWAAAERETLAVTFLQLADRQAGLLLDAGEAQACIEVCQRILAQDACWERAYRLLMLAYHRLGDRGQLARAYQRCSASLREELDVAPAPETQALYERLIA